ncbi:MAG: hypothetical protein K6G73_04985 [Marinilabiliaceae bacterium]|nr:hypothetical protein [Marinilabiliaceae bacterium]
MNKKLYCLTFACSLFAISQAADNATITIQPKTEYKEQQVITEGVLTLTLGEFNSNNYGDAYTTQSTTVTTDAALEGSEIANAGWLVSLAGSANPKKDGTGANGTIPNNGNYWKVSTTEDGYITIGVVLNAQKAFWIVYEKDGEVVAASSASDNSLTYEGFKSEDKVYANYDFAATAGTTYYVYCNGSKLGLMGVKYSSTLESTNDDSDNNSNNEPSDNGSEEGGTITAITTNSADQINENAPVYNILGQKVDKNAKGVLIQNGKKYINK